MKTKCLFFFLILFTEIFFPLLAQTQQITNEEIITVKGYNHFLNEVASSDWHHLYERVGGSDLILRFGKLGNYHYDTAASESNVSIFFLNADNAEAYCSWKNQGSSVSYFLVSNYPACDKELRSNQITFQILDQLPDKKTSNNTTWFENLQHFMSTSVALGMVLDPAAIRPYDTTLAKDKEDTVLESIICSAILRDDQKWEELSSEIDAAYQEAHEAFFKGQLKAQEDLHAAEKMQECAHDYQVSRAEAVKKGKAETVIQMANNVASNAGGGAVSLVATGISAAVQGASFLRKKFDEAVVQNFDEHLQKSDQKRKDAQEKTSDLFLKASASEEEFLKKEHTRTDEIAKDIRLSSSHLEEWATAIIDRAKAHSSWKPRIIHADPSWMNRVIADAWDSRITQSEAYIQRLHNSDESKEIDELKKQYEREFEAAKQVREILEAIEKKKRDMLNGGVIGYRNFDQAHQVAMKTALTIDLASETIIDDTTLEVRGGLEEASREFKPLETTVQELETAGEVIARFKKDVEEKIVNLKSLFEQYFRKKDLFSKKIARVEKRLEMDKKARDTHWPEKELNIHREKRTWEKAFAEARRKDSQTKDAWASACDEAQKVKVLYDRVIEKYQNRQDLCQDYASYQTERTILEQKIAIALEKINAFKEPSFFPRGIRSWGWKSIGVILVYLFWQQFSPYFSARPPLFTSQVSSWCHRLQGTPDSFLTQIATRAMQCKAMVHSTVEPSQKEPECIDKSTKGAIEAAKESAKKAPQPTTIIQNSNFTGATVILGGKLEIHHHNHNH